MAENPHARRYSAGISGWDGPMPSRSKREKPAVSCRFGGGASGTRTRDQRIMSLNPQLLPVRLDAVTRFRRSCGSKHRPRASVRRVLG